MGAGSTPAGVSWGSGMGNAASTYWTGPRIVAWGITTAVVFAVVGPTYIRAFLPPPSGAYTDFLQEWLSARNYFTGAPIYREIRLSVQEHVKHEPGRSAPRVAFTDPASGRLIAEMKYNAHPPVAVLLAIPFAWMDYPHAHLAWDLITYVLFLVAIVAVFYELGLSFEWPAIFPALILLLGNPVLNQVYQGQLNCLLATLLIAAWVADRHDRPALAGILIGLAGAAKLYPLFLLLYFAFTRRWSGLASGVGMFLAANALAMLVFGGGAFQDYAFTVVPAISGQFQASWGNVSFHGFWVRLFQTEPFTELIDTTLASAMGRGLAWGLSLGLTAIVAHVGVRAVCQRDRDWTFALAIVAMLLVSPIAWSHYYLLLVLPLALVWSLATSAATLWSLGVVLALLWLPSNIASQIWFGQTGALHFNELHHPHLSIIEDLCLVSVPHYAALALFVLTLRLSASTQRLSGWLGNRTSYLRLRRVYL